MPWRNMKGMLNRIAHGYFDITSMWLGDGADGLACPLFVKAWMTKTTMTMEWSPEIRPCLSSILDESRQKVSERHDVLVHAGTVQSIGYYVVEFIGYVSRLKSRRSRSYGVLML